MADGSQINLHDADLRSANLIRAELDSADLSNADLRGAILSFAYLGGADLRGANLKHADLMYADLSYANLTGVLNLDQAFIGPNTIWDLTICPDGSMSEMPDLGPGPSTMTYPVGYPCRGDQLIPLS